MVTCPICRGSGTAPTVNEDYELDMSYDPDAESTVTPPTRPKEGAEVTEKKEKPGIWLDWTTVAMVFGFIVAVDIAKAVIDLFFP